MRTAPIYCLLFTIALLRPHLATGAEPVVVESMDELREAIKKASPDSVIEVVDGDYELRKSLELKRLKGQPEQPITIRAQHDLQVTISGEHAVKLRDSEHLVLCGFRFAMKSDVNGKNGAVSVRNCRHCRITGHEFALDELDTDDGNQTWLTLYGPKSERNRIDHNRFSGKSREGHFIFVTGEEMYVSQHDVIERNHFADLAYGNAENGYETIRIGESRIGNKGGKSFTTIRENFFERCQGEDEIVSFKVGGCSFVGNTVLNCHGSIVFRDGNDGLFSNNMMINTCAALPFDEYRAGGVRFYGAGHRALNNYFEGLNGTSLKAPFALMHGAPAGSGALGSADGLPATNCQIVHNTWVRCAQLRLGHESEKRPLKPEGCIFANNIIVDTEDDRLLHFYEADGVECRGNLLFSRHKKTGIDGLDFDDADFRVVDPKLERNNGVDRISRRSVAVDGGYANLSMVDFGILETDMDGQRRDDQPDVGADEYVESDDALRRPLTTDDVGPTGAKKTAAKKTSDE